MATNDITGARLVSKVPDKEYLDGWDRIFNKNKDLEENCKEGRCIIHDNKKDVIND